MEEGSSFWLSEQCCYIPRKKECCRYMIQVFMDLALPSRCSWGIEIGLYIFVIWWINTSMFLVWSWISCPVQVVHYIELDRRIIASLITSKFFVLGYHLVQSDVQGQSHPQSILGLYLAEGNTNMVSLYILMSNLFQEPNAFWVLLLALRTWY